MHTEQEHLVETAEDTIIRAAAVAERDLTRPRYHFRAPAQWMDDPNGIIFHDGWYHMMYSLNPHSAEHRAGMVYKTAVRVWDPESPDWTGGITVWGHARSRDLIHWEHLPIALYPKVERGEHFIWFGCTALNADGKPIAIYTAVGPHMRPEDTAEQWGAAGTADLMRFTHVPENPLLTNRDNNGEPIREWRDPFVVRDGDRTFLILGAQRAETPSDTTPVVVLYEALDGSLTRWSYKGEIFALPDRSVPSAECPNLIQIGGKWLMLVSPHGPVQYFIGAFDPSAPKFSAEQRGVVDYSSNFYATNVLFDRDGRALMWGAVEGFTGTSGWNGCVSLPREIDIAPEGLLQRPARELESLRGAAVEAKLGLGAGERRQMATVADPGCSEFSLRFDDGRSLTFTLAHGAGEVTISITDKRVIFEGLDMPLPARFGQHHLRLFVDRTVLELFVDEILVATRVVGCVSGSGQVFVRNDGSLWLACELTAWQLMADDLFSFHESLKNKTSDGE